MKADSRDGQPLAPAGAQDARPVALSCRSIWKIFGPRAAEFLASRSGPVTQADLTAANLIGAVRDASLSVKRGEIFIIMGLSGSGKSTLLRCLSRLVEPTAGAVEFEGRDLLKLSEAELIEIRRHKMGMVFQHFALLPHLTVLENVAFPLAVQGIGRKSREDRAREVIELVGLEGREHHYPRELSGGQQQRVGIARSLAVKPDIWFLDEPFSALDPLIRREMQEELMRLQSVLRKTIIFITHDFDEAIRLADRIAIMKDGEIIQSGTPEELVLHPATDYVAEFTRDVQRAKVMSAARLMQPLSGKTVEEAPRIHADTKVAAFAAEIVAARKCFIVVGPDNLPIGEITPEAVIGLLAGSEHAGPQR
ncbi:MAG TPA: glycine betaine/L-proline ABC transporter ATP-binding protein [Aestuariivirgaceae bacterium]|nr:glycine betaine/L-proline ABC transporter ATP-binding protein [Aestuariivirgaceae bacterium]